jgi:putative copper resistance protein D
MDDATLPDLVDLLLRTASTVSGFSAAGIAWFLLAFGHRLRTSGPRLHRYAQRAALVTLPLLIAHLAMQAARMGGEMSALADPGLQHMALGSGVAVGVALQAPGLVALQLGLRAATRAGLSIAACGAVLLASGFLATGHVMTHAQRWWLAPLLLTHLLIVQFWLGSLVALLIVTTDETLAVAAAVVARFSTAATPLVPLIAVAGAAMATALLPGWSAFALPYGQLLLVKVALFAGLLVLAALNRWRLGPALARTAEATSRPLRRVVAVEALVIVVVLAVTFGMTTWYSPQ